MSTLNIIQSVLNKQPAGTENAFKDAIRPNVSNRIEVKRAEVGANLFKTVSKDTKTG